MTLAEKIGQMCQVNGAAGQITDALRSDIANGHIGSVINEVDATTVNELQRIAIEESRLGIPLLIGRDVIHGFRTIFPIPLGQAATWNPDLVRQSAAVAANEAAGIGINWAFSPMLDIGRDPRWGRIAETFGEDPVLISRLGTAMITGYQGHDLSAPQSLAACAKHFAGYGATEAGRDYNTTDIPEIELRNVHLAPFEAAADAGVATVMAGFSDLNGVPCTGNAFLLDQVLRREWQYSGFVVSDWESVAQLETHGYTEDSTASAERAVNAGVDMEMASTTFRDHLAELIASGHINEQQIDAAVTRILQLKFSLGLFEGRAAKASALPPKPAADDLTLAHAAAKQSIVLLTNTNKTLPLAREQLTSVAVIGPLADAPQDQLGTWVFDGDADIAITPLQAIREAGEGSYTTHYARGNATTRSHDENGFAEALAVATSADMALLFVGEEAALSGEAHCRADITLPGNQAELIEAVAETGTKVVLVILAGRPLALHNVIDQVDAILYAWHPGTMAGPAICDLLFGVESPSAKLPVTLPRATGQIPIYYAQKNTGRPGIPDCPINMDTISDHDEFDSRGFTSFHLDTGCTPLFCFGHGLSYTTFNYRNLRVPESAISMGDTFKVSAEISNDGDVTADEIVQLYVRDLVGSVTRPVKELKDFQRITLRPGETQTVTFELHTDALAFFGADMQRNTEPGKFHVWIGPDSTSGLRGSITLT